MTKEYIDNSPNESLELQPEIVQVRPLKGTKPEKGESRKVVRKGTPGRSTRNIKHNQSLQRLKLG